MVFLFLLNVWLIIFLFIQVDVCTGLYRKVLGNYNNHVMTARLILTGVRREKHTKIRECKWHQFYMIEFSFVLITEDE